MEIRPYTTGDLKEVAAIFSKVIYYIMGKVSHRLAPVPDWAFICDGHDGAAAEVYRWFASLIGKTAEEFDAMPANTIPAIIEAIEANRGSKGFFDNAYAITCKNRPAGKYNDDDFDDEDGGPEIEYIKGGNRRLK